MLGELDLGGRLHEFSASLLLDGGPDGPGVAAFTLEAHAMGGANEARLLVAEPGIPGDDREPHLSVRQGALLPSELDVRRDNTETPLLHRYANLHDRLL